MLKVQLADHSTFSGSSRNIEIGNLIDFMMESET